MRAAARRPTLRGMRRLRTGCSGSTTASGYSRGSSAGSISMSGLAAPQPWRLQEAALSGLCGAVLLWALLLASRRMRLAGAARLQGWSSCCCSSDDAAGGGVGEELRLLPLAVKPPSSQLRTLRARLLLCSRRWAEQTHAVSQAVKHMCLVACHHQHTGDQTSWNMPVLADMPHTTKYSPAAFPKTHSFLEQAPARPALLAAHARIAQNSMLNSIPPRTL